MKLMEIIDEQSIVLELKAADKESVIRELTDFLAQTGKISPSRIPELTQAIMDREQHGSTAIGEEIAIPHTRHECVTKLVAVMGRAAEGIDFESLDGHPTRLFLLMVSPPDSGRKHVKALAHISRLLIKEDVRAKILNATSSEEIINTINQEECKFEH